MNAAPSPSEKNTDFSWNAVWREARRKRTRHQGGCATWNRRAPAFAAQTKRSHYARKFLQLFQIPADWSVLDVGCGAGTLAIPLAGTVRTVTAIDLSPVMIAILQDRCRTEEINNIATKVLGWEDDWPAAGIGCHDLVIASRSLVIDDLEAALKKLDTVATRQVVVTSLVGDGPFDRRIFEAIGRPLDRGPDYLCIYNLLHQMGIFANLTFILKKSAGAIYTDIEAAVSGLDWMLGDITREEELRLKTYLTRSLVKKSRGWVLPYSAPLRWAVISWQKEPGSHDNYQ